MQTVTLVLLAAASALYLFYLAILRPVFFSPLARIPKAHWSCSMSNAWILWARKQGKENRSLFNAHSQHGPVVRVAPNTLSVDGVDAMRAIYQGGFDKAHWYKVFDNYGVPSMFSTLGSKEHSRRKRMISNVYSKSYIHSSSAARAQSKVVLAERLLPLLQQEAVTSGSKGTEVQSIFMATTMDLISSYIFGMRHGTNFLQDKTYRDHWLQLYLSRHHHHFWPQELPGLTSLCARLGFRLYPSFVDSANEEIRSWNKQLCDNTSRMLKTTSGQVHPPADEPVVFKAMHAGIDKEERVEGEDSIIYSTAIQQRDSAIASEILDQVLAGHETAGIVLTYIAWRLSQSPDLQAQLRDELLSITPSVQINENVHEDLPDPKVLDNLPLLNAIVMETLRLHAPIPGPQPRSTPYPSCHIGGYKIPGGVRIASLAYTLHLDERVFSDAKTWDPTRWLPRDQNDDEQKDMKRQFWAFGSGGRMCIGSNFALTGIKNVIAAVYTNFATSIVNDDGIEQTDGYSSRPVGDELYIRFAAL